MAVLYCEECGSRIVPGSRFCEECGTPIPIDLLSESLKIKTSESFCSVFEDDNWSDIWASDSSLKGIIAFNSQSCTDSSSFKFTLEKYLQFSQERGINYYVLDFNNQRVKKIGQNNDIQSFIQVLSAIYEVSKPNYLLLIGNEKSIPDISWENESQDGDSKVFSDLPYLTFDTTSPFLRYKTNFEDMVSIGRIPASASDNFNLAVRYLNNVIVNNKVCLENASFGIAAYEWKSESEACFSTLGRSLLFSPDVDLNTVRSYGILGLNNGRNPSLMYFNLHGSEQTKFWYGQRESVYPEVIDPQIVKDYVQGYFVGVEACYGAKYHGLSVAESILLSALSNGCLGFLGSSKIAYGTSQEPGCCADIIVREYLKGLKKGLSAGAAYLKSLKSLVVGQLDDATIKTMAEFALYGDPSLKMNNERFENAKSGKAKSHLFVNVPDVRTSVRYSLCNVSSRIENKLKEYLGTFHKDFVNIKPKHYKPNGIGRSQSIYEKNCGAFKQVLKIYYDEDGNITNDCISK